MKTTQTLRQALVALAALLCIGFSIVACDNGSTDVGNNGETKQLGDIKIYNHTLDIDTTKTNSILAIYLGTEQSVSMRWNKNGNPVGTAENGRTIELTASSADGEGIYTVTVSVDGFEIKSSGEIIALDMSGAMETEGGFNYRKLGDFSVVTGYVGTVPEVLTIPDTLGGCPVAGIFDNAFADKNITSVSIPNSVVIIGEDAFTKNKLTSVTIPSSVTSIGKWAFSKNSLTNITIPDSVTSIMTAVFWSNNLTSITIPSSVTSIGAAAFAHNELTSIVIPSSVTIIGDQAFLRNKLTSVTIGSNVYIGNEFTFGGAYTDALRTLYNGNDKLAGTYTYDSTSETWTKD